MFNELLVYGGGVLTVLLTIIVYRLLIRIPSFISPLPYLPLLFSFLIPLWNHLFE